MNPLYAPGEETLEHQAYETVREFLLTRLEGDYEGLYRHEIGELFHCGPCKHPGCTVLYTRAVLWRAISKLEKEGFLIYAHTTTKLILNPWRKS